MTWFGWVMIALETIVSIRTIGDNDVDPRMRVAAVIAACLIIVGILTVGTGSL